jgi:hypothetical protein
MMMKHWTPGPMPPELIADRQGYQRALEAARRAQQRRGGASLPALSSTNGTALTCLTTNGYVDYWIGRLEFGIGYLDTIEAVHRAATAEAENQPQEALQHAEAALSAARRALEAYARVARDRSDLGAIATMNEYVYRPLKEKVAEMKK